jgi:hypothetical protein
MADRVPLKNSVLSRNARANRGFTYAPTHTASLGDFFNLSWPISKRGRALLEGRLLHDARRNIVPDADIQIIIEKMRRRIAKHNSGFTQAQRDLAETSGMYAASAMILANGTAILELGFYYRAQQRRYRRQLLRIAPSPTSEKTHG